MKHCVVPAGILLSLAGSAWADCSRPADAAACRPAWPALDSATPELSFAAASSRDYAQLVLYGRDRPPALTPVNAEEMPIAPALSSAIQGAEDVAAGRGGLVTASAVPEPRGYALMLAGLAVVAVLLRRRARRED